MMAIKPRQPAPVERRTCIRAPLARRGCVWCWFPRPVMSREFPLPNDPVSPEEAAAFARLRTTRWRKVAMMVAPCNLKR
jgi:hypothetical protein